MRAVPFGRHSVCFWHSALATLGPLLLLFEATDAALTVPATVPRVVDGNTMCAEDASGKKLRIRLLGIDAPEVGHPHKRGGAGERAMAAETMRRTGRPLTIPGTPA